MKQCCFMRKPAGAGSPAGLSASAFIKYISPLYIPLSQYNPLSLYPSVLKKDFNPPGLVTIRPANKLIREAKYATAYPNVPQTGGNLGIGHSTACSWVASGRVPFIKIEEKVLISQGDYMSLVESQGRWEE